MKPSPFEYVRPRDLSHALDLLADNPGEARLLAGGQTLMPLLNMRMANAPILVDIAALPELSGIEDHGDAIRVGAVTTYREIEKSPLVTEILPLLPTALEDVAHPAIRSRGTLGGSLALADPAGEMPAVALALRATVVARSRRGERRIPIDEFLRGIWETALEEDEAIVAVEYPKPGPDARFAFREFSRRHGDFALVGLIIAVDSALGARSVVFGVGPRAFRVAPVDSWLAAEPSPMSPPSEVLAGLTALVEAAVEDPAEGKARAAIARTLLVRSLPLRPNGSAA